MSRALALQLTRQTIQALVVAGAAAWLTGLPYVAIAITLLVVWPLLTVVSDRARQKSVWQRKKTISSWWAGAIVSAGLWIVTAIVLVVFTPLDPLQSLGYAILGVSVVGALLMAYEEMPRQSRMRWKG